MKKGVNTLCQAMADSRDTGEIFNPGTGHFLHSPQMFQKSLPLHISNSWNLL